MGQVVSLSKEQHRQVAYQLSFPAPVLPDHRLATPGQSLAKERVFAIPELLELILSDDGLTMEELYHFQRVNKQFYGVITSSAAKSKLRLKLGQRCVTDLEYEGVGAGIGYSILGSYLRYKAPLNTVPFSLSYGLSEAEDTLFIYAVMNTGTTANTRTCGDVMGLPGHSWKLMKLTLLTIKIVLKIIVEIPSTDNGPTRFSLRCPGKKYEEEIVFAAGEGALGDLMRALQDRSDREQEQHTRLAQEECIIDIGAGNPGSPNAIMTKRKSRTFGIQTGGQ